MALSKEQGTLLEKPFQKTGWVVEGKCGKDAKSKCSPPSGLGVSQYLAGELDCFNTGTISKLN